MFKGESQVDRRLVSVSLILQLFCVFKSCRTCRFNFLFTYFRLFVMFVHFNLSIFTSVSKLHFRVCHTHFNIYLHNNKRLSKPKILFIHLTVITAQFFGYCILKTYFSRNFHQKQSDMSDKVGENANAMRCDERCATSYGSKHEGI